VPPTLVAIAEDHGINDFENARMILESNLRLERASWCEAMAEGKIWLIEVREKEEKIRRK
jgi:hypothetical protein